MVYSLSIIGHVRVNEIRDIHYDVRGTCGTVSPASNGCENESWGISTMRGNDGSEAYLKHFVAQLLQRTTVMDLLV